MSSQTLLKTKQDLHLTRKLFHFLGVMAMVACLLILPEKICWFLLLSLGGSFIATDLLRQKSQSLNRFVHKIFGPVLRQSEAHKLCGVTFLVLGSGLSLFIFDKQIVILALLFLGIADPLASLVGVKYGSIKIFSHKSIQGSFAAFIACALSAFIFLNYFHMMTDHILIVSLIAGLAGTLAELVPVFNLDDNFTQPLLNSASLTLLFLLFGGL